MSWEDEDFEPVATKPVPAVRSAFDDEEEDDDNNVKESWDMSDDDDKPASKEGAAAAAAGGATSTAAVAKKKKKSWKQIAAEKEKEKLERKVDPFDNAEDRNRLLTPEEEAAEKLRRQKLIEEADLQNAKDLFSTGGEDAAPALTGDSIDTMRPKSAADFDKLEKAIAKKLGEYEHSVEYVPFLETLFRDLCAGVSSEDIRRIISVLNVLLNEKQKAEKGPANKGKKKAPPKKVVALDEDFVDGEYDDFM
eukprot:Opistho-2@64372